MALVELHQLSLDRRLKSVSLSLHDGEMLGLIGPNGSGKTSMLHCLAGIEPYQGSVQFLGQSLQCFDDVERARGIGLLPQGCQSAWSLSVRDIISLGRLAWRDENPQKISDAAKATGVDRWLDQPIDKLSGGEQLRVWLARVLAGEPRVLLADEPLASLDLYFQSSMLSLLRHYAQPASQTLASRSVVVSLHDLSMAARFCDRLCLLNQGEVFALGTPAEVLTKQNLMAVYQVNTRIDLLANPPIISVLD